MRIMSLCLPELAERTFSALPGKISGVCEVMLPLDCPAPLFVHEAMAGRHLQSQGCTVAALRVAFPEGSLNDAARMCRQLSSQRMGR